MKVKLTHTECGREVLVQQVLESQGHCPWDGKPFNKDYTAVLAEALEQLEMAGSTIENALEKISGMEPSFTLDYDSLVAPIDYEVDFMNRQAEERARSRRR